MARARNPRLKKANQETEYTYDQLQELRKCADDPIHFIKNYVRIQHPTKGAIPFALYPYQENMVRAYQDNRNVVVLSSRQTGKCVVATTRIGVIKLSNISYFKKIILWLIDRKTHNEIFKED